MAITNVFLHLEPGYDLTRALQQNMSVHTDHDGEPNASFDFCSPNDMFIWNRYLHLYHSKGVPCSQLYHSFLFSYCYNQQTTHSDMVLSAYRRVPLFMDYTSY